MTARELLIYEINHMERQLRGVTDAMPAALQDLRLTASSLSPRQTLEHLCEVYQATLTESKGGKHEWGSFAVLNTEWQSLVETLWVMRRAATDAVTIDEDEKRIRSGHDYIVSHDAYHVGQLALIRMSGDSLWDPYSIYGE
jgi:hypothetical protein